MIDQSYEIQLRSSRSKRSKSSTKWDRLVQMTSEGFTCINCHTYVSNFTLLSGVVNRNHCPYCLWSRHLDLFKAGDRLAACKEKMKPVALTLKISQKKYGCGLGEMMLVHLCTECSKISINRIAADDIADTIFEVFERSLVMDLRILERINQHAIVILGLTDITLVKERLYGL